MEADLVNYQQMGIPKEDLAAGLSFSVVCNYLEKGVGGKRIGQKILLLGGVAFNESVVSALQRILNREVIVPEHHDVSGAIGMALIARDEYNSGNKKTSAFRGFKESDSKYKLTSFQCSDCANNCRINRVVADEQFFYIGDVCGKYEQKKTARRFANIFKQRMELMLAYHNKKEGGKKHVEKIGIPRAHLFYEYFPVWCTFLQELGFEVVASDPTDKTIIDMALERTPIDNCFPCKLMYGHVSNLIKQGVSRIFLPIVVEFARKLSGSEHNFACPYVQCAPAILSWSSPM